MNLERRPMVKGVADVHLIAGLPVYGAGFRVQGSGLGCMVTWEEGITPLMQSGVREAPLLVRVRLLLV